MTVAYIKNLESLPDIDKFPSSGNDFLKDIQDKAKKYILSDRQIEAAQRVWNKIEAARASGQTILSPWDENVKRFPKLGTEELHNTMRDVTNEFLWDLFSKAKRFVLSDKQIEAFKNAYQRESSFFTPPDKVAFDLLIRAVSLTPRGDWILNELGDYPHSHKIKTGIYTKIMDKAQHFRKSIFGHVFDPDKNSADYYIRRISG